MNLILLGAPGAGKGTQAEIISAKYAIPTISTGNMIRAAIKNGTEMGLAAKAYTESGGLVPDDVVIGIIRERLAEPDCQAGFILDGFPRTVPQAEHLDQMGVSIDKVLEIAVADEVILERLSGRRTCEDCSASYHVVSLPSKKEGVCDKCGGRLVIRKDDQPDTIRARLQVYHEQTEPVRAYYQKAGKLVSVEGRDEIEATTALVLAALEA